MEGGFGRASGLFLLLFVACAGPRAAEETPEAQAVEASGGPQWSVADGSYLAHRAAPALLLSRLQAGQEVVVHHEAADLGGTRRCTFRFVGQAGGGVRGLWWPGWVSDPEVPARARFVLAPHEAFALDSELQRLRQNAGFVDASPWRERVHLTWTDPHGNPYRESASGPRADSFDVAGPDFSGLARRLRDAAHGG